MKKTIFLVLILCGYINLSCRTDNFKEFASSNDSPKKQELANILIPFRKGKKWGYSDVNKKIVVPFKYDALWIRPEKLSLNRNIIVPDVLKTV